MSKQGLYTSDDKLIGFIQITDTGGQLLKINVLDHTDGEVKNFDFDKGMLTDPNTETALTNRIRKALSLTDINKLESDVLSSQISKIFEPYTPKEAKPEQEEEKKEPAINDIINSYPDDIRELAELLLTKGDPFSFILETWNLRHLGDKTLGKNCLCSVASTYIMNTEATPLKPSGESGKGKSSGMEAFLFNCLPSRKYITGSMSAKSAFYDDRLKSGMVLYMDDAHLNDELIATMKQSTSNFQKPTIHRTVKKQQAHETLIPARINWWLTSVDSIDDEQLANRMLNADVDGSKAQDIAVAQYKLKSESALFADNDEDLLVCQCMYDMLDVETYRILIPYAECIKWNNPENRRNLSKFMDMIRAVALYNIKQRECITINVNGSQDKVYLANIDDYKRALAIYQANAGKNATNLSEKEMNVFRLFAANQNKSILLDDIAGHIGKTQQTARDLMHGRDGKGGLLAKIEGLRSDKRTHTLRTTEDKTVSTRRNEYTYTGDADLMVWDTSISELDTNNCKQIIDDFKKTITGERTDNELVKAKSTTRDRILKHLK